MEPNWQGSVGMTHEGMYSSIMPRSTVAPVQRQCSCPQHVAQQLSIVCPRLYALRLVEQVCILVTRALSYLCSFLSFTATGRLSISHGKLGPTEFRIAIVVINTLLVFYGTRRMAKSLRSLALRK